MNRNAEFSCYFLTHMNRLISCSWLLKKKLVITTNMTNPDPPLVLTTHFYNEKKVLYKEVIIFSQKNLETFMLQT